MKKLIKKLLREELLIENTLYLPKIIKVVTDRIGDSSDETLNKLAIVGLYRNSFVDGFIQQIKSKEQLDEAFGEWYEDIIKELVGTDEFVEDRVSATKYLDAYVKNIKSVDKHVGFSTRKMKKFAEKLTDIVNCGGIPTQGEGCPGGWVNDVEIQQKTGIYEPDPEDKVHEDENVIILDTNTKAKCVAYGQGESWCITKPELNYYNTYRINYGATPYFVLQKNVKSPEHKLVIMHYKSGYAIADQTNRPPRHGGNQRDNGPWSEVESQIPNLKGMEEYFPYREITEDERRYSNILQEAKGYEDNNLQGYIDNVIKGLVINDSQVIAKDFIRDLAATGVKITDDQIKSLRKEVLESLIEGGYFLRYDTGDQIKLLSDNHQMRVIRLKINNNLGVNIRELLTLPLKEQHEFLKKMSPKQFERINYDAKQIDGYEEVLSDRFNNSDTPTTVLFMQSGGSAHGKLIKPETIARVNKELTPKMIDSMDADVFYSVRIIKEFLSEDILRYICNKNYDSSRDVYYDNLEFLPKYRQNMSVIKVLDNQSQGSWVVFDTLKVYHDPVKLINMIKNGYTNLEGERKTLGTTDKVFKEAEGYQLIGLITSVNDSDGMFKELSPYLKKEDTLSYFNQLTDSLDDTSMVIKFIGSENLKGLSNYNVIDVIEKSKNKAKTIKELGIDVLNNLDGYDIQSLLSQTTKPIAMGKALGNEILSKLKPYRIVEIIRDSKSRSMVKVFKNNIAGWDKYNKGHLLDETKYKVEAIKTLGVDYANEMESYDIIPLISDSKKPSDVIAAIGKEVVLEKLSTYNITRILTESKNVNDVVKGFGKETILDMFSKWDIKIMFEDSETPNKLILALGSGLTEKLETWDWQDVLNEIKDVPEKEAVKKTLKSFGVHTEGLSESTITKEALNEFRRLGGLPLL